MQKFASFQKTISYELVEKTEEDIQAEQLYLEQSKKLTEKYAV